MVEKKKRLQDYMMGLKKDHDYTIRVLVPEIPDKDMTRIENNLKAHELVNISKIKKTIFQSAPYGFPDPTMKGEVCIFNITLGLPVSCFYLSREIAKILGISEIYVCSHGIDNPPPELDITPSGETTPTYAKPEIVGDELAGGKYVAGFLKTILDSRKKDPLSIIKTAKN